MAALEEALGVLHEITAEKLTAIIRDGVPIVNRETGEIEGYGPAPAPYIAAAIKFLKDNNIESLPTEDAATTKLAQTLPNFTDEDGLHARH